MAEELKIIIDADVTQAQQALAGIQDSANKTATSLKNVAPAANAGLAATAQQAKVVQLSVSNLGRTIDDLKQKVAGKQALISTERDVTSIARLNKEIQALQAEIIRVQNIGKSGFNEFGQASAEATDKLISGFNNAFSAVRRLAFILPGIGIAGIIGFASEAVIGFAKDLFNLGASFDDAALASANFKNELESLDDFLNSTRKSLDFSNEINKLKNELTFGRGFKADVLSQGFDLDALNKQFDLLGKVLDDNFKEIDARIAAASFNLGKEGKKLFDAFTQQAELIPQDLIDKLGDSDKKFLSELKSLTEETTKINKERGVIQQEIEKQNLQKQVDAHEQQLKEQKEFLQKQQQQVKAFIDAASKSFKFFEIPVQLRITDFDSEIEKIRKGLDVIKGIRTFEIKLKTDIELPDIKELPKEQVEKFFKNVPSALQDAVNKGLIDAQGRDLNIDTGPFAKEIAAIIEKFNQAGLKIPVVFDLKDADLLKKLQDAFPIEQIQKNVDELKKSIGTEDTFQGFIRDLIKLGDEGQKEFDAVAKAALDAGDSITEALRKASDAQKSVGGISKEAGEAALVLQQTLAPAFESLFSAILEGQAPLDAFFKSLIRGIDQLIAKLIAAALEALILSTITGGIGGFGGIFKALLGFAKGGDPSPDKPFIAGEKGWELIVPKTSMHVFTHEQSKSILSSSVKDNESIKEYLIASRISQQLKEHFSSAFKSIETTVKTISASHDKLISYSYRLHESVSSLKETFVSSTDKHVTSAIEKTNNSLSASFNKLISERPQATIGTQSSHYEKSFDNLEKFITSTGFAYSFSEWLKENNSSLSTTIEKLSSFKALHEKINSSDRSVTIERIINNNFYSSEVKESFKSMSLTDIQRTFHIPAFAQGGAVFGPTLAILGEGFGISRSNPEFVGTASQLKGIQGGQFDINVSVDGELSFSMGKLAVALNREVRSQLRTSGKNPF